MLLFTSTFDFIFLAIEFGLKRVVLWMDGQEKEKKKNLSDSTCGLVSINSFNMRL